MKPRPKKVSPEKVSPKKVKDPVPAQASAAPVTPPVPEGEDVRVFPNSAARHSQVRPVARGLRRPSLVTGEEDLDATSIFDDLGAAPEATPLGTGGLRILVNPSDDVTLEVSRVVEADVPRICITIR